MAKRKKKTKKEFSKTWIAVIMTAFLVDLNLLIVLNRMENLAIALVGSGIMIFGGYMCKAYYGKRNEEENKMVYDLAKEIEEDEES